MPVGTRVQIGNEAFDQMLYLSAVPTPLLGASASATTTLTVNGVLPNDLISWNLQAPAAHVVLDNAYVSSANTITFLWGTDGTGAAAGTVNMIMSVTRCENAAFGTAGFPGAIV
jgi:hypothetical protein